MADLRSILQKAGFSGSSLDTAYAIAMAESGGNARAHNGNAGTGDNSYGLFQINMLGGMGPERRRAYGLSSNEDLFDAERNAKIAYQMSKGGTDWSPWSTYKRGDYRKYLGQSGASVSGADGQGSGTDFLTQEAPPQKADIISSGLGQDFAPGAEDFTPRPQQPVPADGSGANTAPQGSTGDAVRDKIIAAAMGYIGTPYSWGGGSASGATRGIGRGAGTVGLDCSGLVLAAFAAAGVDMPRVSWDQLARGQRTSISNLRAGDLVGFRDGGHIAIYLGDGQIIEAPRTGLNVRVRTLGKNESAWGVRLSI